jgi:hypothetical protein
MDEIPYPDEDVRPLVYTLRSAMFSWHDAEHRPVVKFAEDMTMQEFLDVAGEQPGTLQKHARMIAAFMNQEGAGEQTTLGEILSHDLKGDRRQRIEINEETVKQVLLNDLVSQYRFLKAGEADSSNTKETYFLTLQNVRTICRLAEKLGFNETLLRAEAQEIANYEPKSPVF